MCHYVALLAYLSTAIKYLRHAETESLRQGRRLLSWRAENFSNKRLLHGGKIVQNIYLDVDNNA